MLMRQRFDADCAVCCLAMFLGLEYEDVAKHCAGYELVWAGLTNDRERAIASLYRVDVEFVDGSRIDWDRPAVVTVPSLNACGERPATHAVYWDGERSWDPNSGREGKRVYTNQLVVEAAIEAYQRA